MKTVGSFEGVPNNGDCQFFDSDSLQRTGAGGSLTLNIPHWNRRFYYFKKLELVGSLSLN
jgi:hypothetical protein